MALYVGGSPITPTQLATLQADLGIVVAEEITARLTSLVSTDDTIFLRAGVPHLAAASVIADYVGVIGGAQTLTPARLNNSNTFYSHTLSGGAVVLTPSRFDNAQTFYGPTLSGGAVTLTPSRFDNSQTFYAPTVAPAGGSPAYIEETVTTGFGTLVGTLPSGVTASDYLTAIVWSTIDGAAATMSAPSGWTAGDGVQNPTELRGARVFTAPGNVGTLTFTGTNIQGLQIIGTTAPLRAGYVLAAADYNGGTSGAGSGGNQPTRPVTANLGDLVVSSYIQYDAGAGGPLASPGSPQAGYTRQRFDNAAAPYLSILSAENVAAGTTGTINHDANGGFSGRFLFTGAYGT